MKKRNVLQKFLQESSEVDKERKKNGNRNYNFLMKRILSLEVFGITS